MAHQIQIQELINGIQITETVDNEIVIKFLSYQGKPFFRTTNETDEETYQIIDKVGEIYNLPALATEFVLIDINDVVYIPVNGEELIEYSVKLKPFRSETEEDESHTGLITTTANSLTINLPGDGVNWAKINGTFYERFYPDTFNFAPVTTGQKILIVYAIPDAMPFRLVQGVEGTEAVEPDYDGLFIARILVSSAGQVVEEAEPLRPKIQEESAWRNIIATNTAQWLQMTGTAGTSFNVQVAAGSSAPKIAGLRTKVNQNVYDGMELHFYNDSDTVVTFVAGDYAQTPNSTSIPFKENYIVQPGTTVEFKRKNNLFEIKESGATFPTGDPGDVLVKTATGEEFSPRLTEVEAQTDSVVDKFLHYWDSTAKKWLSSGLKFVSGVVNQLEFTGRIKADAIVLPANSNAVVANRLRSDGTSLYYANELAVERRLLDTEAYRTERVIGSSTTHITGTLTLKRKTETVVTSGINGNSVFTIALETPLPNEVNEYILCFLISGTTPIINFPANIKWRGKSPVITGSVLSLSYCKTSVSG